MTDIRALVREFNEYAEGSIVQDEPSALGVPQAIVGGYASLLAHNGNDLYAALFGYDIISIASNLTKLLYSLYSMAAAYGIDVDALLPEAHKASMANVDLIRAGNADPQTWNTIEAFVEKTLWKDETLGN